MRLKTWLPLEDAARFVREQAGGDIKVAILDSGVDTSSPALATATLLDDLAVVESEGRLQVVDGQGEDTYGHGTAVADIIHRLAPEAGIGSFRVLGPQLRSRTAIIEEGARQAIDRGYDILNCSFGCGRLDQVLQYKEWIDKAYLEGRHIVAACHNVDATQREWPGHFPTVITVNFLAMDHSERFCWRSGTLVEFGAAGVNVDVAWLDGTRKRVTGSSFAAPHMAGLLARLLSGCPQLPPLQAKALLQQMAAPWPRES